MVSVRTHYSSTTSTEKHERRGLAATVRFQVGAIDGSAVEQDTTHERVQASPALGVIGAEAASMGALS